MRISRKLAALAAFFVIGAVVAGCGSSIPGNSVASVAGNPVSLQAFNHWMYVAAKDQSTQAAEEGENEPVIVANDPPKFTSCIKQIRSSLPTLAKSSATTLRSDCQEVFTEYTSEVMSFLVEGYWFQADAHKLGVSAAKINSGFNKALKKEFSTKSALTSYLSTSGQTKQDLLYQYRVQTLYSKLLKRYEKPITKAAIAAYFKAHQSSFGTSETRDVHLVRTKSQADAQAVISALNSGKSWNTVAAKYAEDASAKKNGGVLNDVTNGEEESAVNKAIFSAATGKVVGPVKGIFGWYALEVTKVTPATHESLAKVTSTIKTDLTNAQQTAAEKKVLALSKKYWWKTTTCRSPYQVKADCSNYKAPKTTTTATPTPTSSSTSTTSDTGTSTAATSSTPATATTATKTTS